MLTLSLYLLSTKALFIQANILSFAHVTIGAAFLPSLIRPTQLRATDCVKIGPTAAPDLGNAKLAANAPRGQSNEICGYVLRKGSLESPITCGPSETCAVNTYYGAQGCCKKGAKQGQACTIPTACVPFVSTNTCKQNSCPEYPLTTTCDIAAPSCYRYLYVATIPPNGTTTLINLGCDRTGETRLAQGLLSVDDIFPTTTPPITSVNTTPVTESLPSTSSEGSDDDAVVKAIRVALGGAFGVWSAIMVVVVIYLTCRHHQRTMKNRQKLLSDTTSEIVIGNAVEVAADPLHFEAPGTPLPFEAPSGPVPVEAPSGPLPVELPAVSLPVEAPAISLPVEAPSELLPAEVPSVRSPVEAPSNRDSVRILGDHVRRSSI